MKQKIIAVKHDVKPKPHLHETPLFIHLASSVGKVVNPFKSNVANVVTGIIFSSATYGMWYPAVGLGCAGVAGGRSSQN